MAFNKNKLEQYIKTFNIKELFREMGWEVPSTKGVVKASELNWSYEVIAKQVGYSIIQVTTDTDVLIPQKSTRKTIEREITKLYAEHLLVYIDGNKTKQIWSYAFREAGKPERLIETEYYKGQTVTKLFNKISGVYFDINETEDITLIDVRQRVHIGFHQNADVVTKKFYTGFSAEHKNFIKFIEGLTHDKDREWYASLMLNRLMFCYFIQKQGFLNDDKDYLNNKLREHKKLKGVDKFHSFFRNFLLELFHKGLGGADRDETLLKLIGKIPYLNGGLFDIHQLEKDNTSLMVGDAAFETLFAFFDKWDWVLDTRESAKGNEINPDVIGFIFEKYINERAQMGAYYTKEDITEYISKNCIIPWLVNATATSHSTSFDSNHGEAWLKLANSGDEYIYDAVKKGIPLNFTIPDKADYNWWENDTLWADLPENIRTGLNPNQEELVALRKCWNIPAPDTIALPTEIYRELIDRRRRYQDMRYKIANRELTTINDFITYNLNIRQWIQDTLAETEDPKFIKAFHEALTKVSILDPTCGSGAFLFAALNILQPLYDECLIRMSAMVEGTTKSQPYFTAELSKAEGHPSQDYYVLKSIILNNLYGVDIMHEAVEIAKLRLFLKLAAQVKPNLKAENMGLEPLPDVDFNIRCGNTLVGFANQAELTKAYNTKIEGAAFKEKIETELEVVSKAYQRFKQIQLGKGEDFAAFKNSKIELQIRLDSLNNLLNELKANLYGIYRPKEEAIRFNEWKESHQPFHWIAEYYAIIQGNQGFDVIIGNPPYVEYSKVRKDYYTLFGFKTITAGNLYAFTIERSIQISNSNSYNGMIIPSSAYSTDRMAVLHSYEFEKFNQIYLSFYAERPGKLFEGAERNLVISIMSNNSGLSSSNSIFASQYYKFTFKTRDLLFPSLSYTETDNLKLQGIVPKVGSLVELNLLKKLRKVKTSIGIYSCKISDNILYYRNSGGRYWKAFTDFQVKFILNGNPVPSSRESYIFFNSKEDLKIVTSVLNSTLYYWYYTLHSDSRTNNPSDIRLFPILLKESLKSLIPYCEALMIDLQNNSTNLTVKLKTGTSVIQTISPSQSKVIIDEIDTILAKHFDLTDEELDFIINYDIKYRMSSELDGGDEE